MGGPKEGGKSKDRSVADSSKSLIWNRFGAGLGGHFGVKIGIRIVLESLLKKKLDFIPFRPRFWFHFESHFRGKKIQKSMPKMNEKMDAILEGIFSLNGRVRRKGRSLRAAGG